MSELPIGHRIENNGRHPLVVTDHNGSKFTVEPGGSYEGGIVKIDFGDHCTEFTVEPMVKE